MSKGTKLIDYSKKEGLPPSRLLVERILNKAKPCGAPKGYSGTV